MEFKLGDRVRVNREYLEKENNRYWRNDYYIIENINRTNGKEVLAINHAEPRSEYNGYFSFNITQFSHILERVSPVRFEIVRISLP